MKTKLMLLFLLISSINFAQNGQKSVTDALELMKVQENASYFEVSDEMFKMMSDAKDIDTESKNYISKLSSIKMVRGDQLPPQGSDLYDIFMANVDLKDFSILMTSTNPDRKISFYKKENKNSEKEFMENKNAEKEFLLVSNTIIIYLTGTIDIKSLQEMEGIMNLAGRALGM